jgi:2,4-didehydro-3-deoxy-L-rhamnonate hydrolase
MAVYRALCPDVSRPTQKILQGKGKNLMKFLRYRENGQAVPGVLDESEQVRSLRGKIDDITPSTMALLSKLSDEVAIGELPIVHTHDGLAPPVGNVGKLVGIGLNYVDHARESGASPPEEPITFLIATSAITGPYDDVLLPPGSIKLDWEVELGVVIGKCARRVSEAEALSHVAGYTIVNDISERQFQLERGGQWTKGKSFDSFSPIGPWLVTPDEVGDPQQLSMRLTVNGDRYQNGKSSDMIFSVQQIISYVSHYMSLQPGDVICTGTPAGVGMGMTPPRYLQEGDVMRLEIDRLGHQEQRVVPFS